MRSRPCRVISFESIFRLPSLIFFCGKRLTNRLLNIAAMERVDKEWLALSNELRLKALDYPTVWSNFLNRLNACQIPLKSDKLIAAYIAKRENVVGQSEAIYPRCAVDRSQAGCKRSKPTAVRNILNRLSLNREFVRDIVVRNLCGL